MGTVTYIICIVNIERRSELKNNISLEIYE